MRSHGRFPRRFRHSHILTLPPRKQSLYRIVIALQNHSQMSPTLESLYHTYINIHSERLPSSQTYKHSQTNKIFFYTDPAESNMSANENNATRSTDTPDAELQPTVADTTAATGSTEAQKSEQVEAVEKFKNADKKVMLAGRLQPGSRGEAGNAEGAEGGQSELPKTQEESTTGDTDSTGHDEETAKSENEENAARVFELPFRPKARQTGSDSNK